MEAGGGTAGGTVGPWGEGHPAGMAGQVGECRRVMADRTRAQIQAKAQGMTVSQAQVVGQGYTVAQAKVSMHMVGVTAKVEATVAEQGGAETADVQDVLGKVAEDMVVECFVIYMAAHGRRISWDGYLGCGGDL